jgi:choline dehydrogenase-like flavoprotein
MISDGKNGWIKTFPNDWSYGNNAACVGSGTVTYGAMAWRFQPVDFHLKTRYGAVPGSSLDDWPVSYDELEPYYWKAEYEIGVAGDPTNDPFVPPRKNPYPMPAFSYNREGILLEKAAKRLGLHPFPIPMLRNSVPYNGRAACIRMRTCIGFTCPVGAKAGTQNTVIPAALKTGNCELRINCMVSEILVDDRGKAKGIKYFDADNKLQEQTSDLVVVSASASETARLLLNSKSKLFPNGAGNNNGWVGRNIQDHAYSGAYGLFEDEVYDDVGPGACIAINDFNHRDPDIIGGGVLCNEFIRMPYAFTSIRPPGSRTWGKAHKDFQRQYFKRHIAIHGPVQEMPVFEKRIEVDPVVRDFWGIPVVRFSGLRHDNDIKVAQFLADKAEAWLKEAGAVQTWQSVPGRQSTPGQHQSGTCRMGNDPDTSVTNKYGQLHEIDNIFIADGSLHVTNGGYNPALTILALGYWVGGHIVEMWKGTKMK